MTDVTRDDPVSRVDALVAGIAPRLASPAMHRRDAVLVTGPWLAGVSGVVAALRDRLPEQDFVEMAELAAEEAPVAVVFVVSAAAALTGSDCALLDAAAAETDVVIGVVSKTDVHRKWRDVLATDRDTLTAHEQRYRDIPWVGVAAVPDSGERRVDDLVAAVREQIADADIARRNALRARESRLTAVARRHDHDVGGAGRQARVAVLQEQRSAALRQRRLSKSERTIALRGQIQQARVQLSYFARNRCASVRAELQEDAAGMARRRLPRFEGYVGGRVGEVIAEVESGTTAHLADVAHGLGLTAWESPQPVAALPRVEVPGPPLKSRRLETRLMILLGIGFGLGVALTLSRLFADLAPGLTAAGFVACVAIGLAATVWVVSTRGLLHDRAVLDRWVGEVTASLRAATEQLVATRVLFAESALSAAFSEQDEADSASVGERVRLIDAELREHAVAAARASALRDREMPMLQQALDAVRAELGEPEADGHGLRGDGTRETGESESMNRSANGFLNRFCE